MSEEQKNEVAEAEIVPKHLTEIADEIASISSGYEKKGMEALWAVSSILNEKLDEEGVKNMHILAGILSDRWGEGYSESNLYQIRRVAETFAKAEFDELIAIEGITATKVKDVLNNKAFRADKDRVLAFLKANPTLSTRDMKAIIQHPDRVLEDGTVRPLEDTLTGGEGEEGGEGASFGDGEGSGSSSSGSPLRPIRKFIKQAESLGDVLTDIQFSLKEFDPENDKILEKFLEEVTEMHEQMKNVHGLMEAVVEQTGSYIDGDPVKAFRDKAAQDTKEAEEKQAKARADAEQRAKEKTALKEKKKAEAAAKKEAEAEGSDEDLEAKKKAMVEAATKKALEAKKRKEDASSE
jgi:hypothetical protein